ncbi:MAG: flavin monoamine oxidase family protein [Opitutaceae bacterium]
MPHTPLAVFLRRAAQEALASGSGMAGAQPGPSRPLSRRGFLSSTAAATATVPLLRAAGAKASTARVASVGAGLAGLTCAHRLRQAGVTATVFEAGERIGGRCWTIRGEFAGGQIAEHGGELIDQGHTRVRQLAQELGLPLDNLLAAEVNGTEPFFHFDGSYYAYADAVDDLKRIWQPLHRDLSEAGYPTLFDRYTARGQQLDRMSISDWINTTVPGGVTSPLGRLLDVAYTIEYGAECSRQSALNLIYLLGYNSPGQFALFGASNEKYHVRGGNDLIVRGLAAAVGNQVRTGTALTAVRQLSAGGVRLTLQDGARSTEATFDRVVFALPFSILRSSVDLAAAGFSERKLTAIRQLGMGSNSKLNLQFNARPWVTAGCNGESYSDLGYQLTWEVTRGQPGAGGILVNYTGGAAADGFSSGTPATLTRRFLSQSAPVLPGLRPSWNGLSTVDCWASNPWSLGSYAYFQPGQYTLFAGIEGRAEGAAHFCGEHTSRDAQGYLEGAVETGERAAAEVVAAIG